MQSSDFESLVTAHYLRLILSWANAREGFILRGNFEQYEKLVQASHVIFCDQLQIVDKFGIFHVRQISPPGLKLAYLLAVSMKSGDLRLILDSYITGM